MAGWRSLIATVILAALLSVGAAAQSVIENGTRVRLVVAHSPRLTGTYVRMFGDSLDLVADDPPRRLRISAQLVRRIEVSRGRGTGAGRGALIGGVLGVASGVVFALTAPRGDLSRGQLLAFGGAGFGAIGGALGFFFGSFTTIEKWGQGSVPHPVTGPSSSEWTLRVGIKRSL